MHITISVSGGCDSVALLHACMEWLQPWLGKDSMDISLHVVHFNHEQRGEQSDQDAVFVQELCDSYGIPCHVQTWSDPQPHQSSVEGMASSSLTSKDCSTTSFSQDTARQWRRQCLMEYTQKQLDELHNNSPTGAKAVGVILTAHHRDDAMESLLLKALRGVHLFNLSGMKAVSPLTTNPTQQQDDTNVYLVRPWLEQPKLQLAGFDKTDILQYLHASNYTWRDDKSNDSNKYLRNRVRHELMPLLQDLTRGGLASRLDHWVQQSEQLREDVQPRVQAHLNKILVPSIREPERFVLDWEMSLAQADTSRLIRSQALYEWITNDIRVVQGTHALRDLISHDTLQRVLHQLEVYPSNVEWTLQLGKGWNIVRKGAILRLKLDGKTSGSGNAGPQPSHNVWNCKVVDTKNESTLVHSKNARKFRLGRPIQLQIPQDWITCSSDEKDTTCWTVEETTVSAYESELQETMNGDSQQQQAKTPSSTRTAIMFVPPWKKDNTPIKLRSFLRRQGVAFADRDDTPILVGRSTLLGDGNTVTRLLAVQVPVYDEDDTTTKLSSSSSSQATVPVDRAMEWIVHGDFVAQKEKTGGQCGLSSSNHPSTRIVLEPRASDKS
eukprot:Nitzschia sp. Nitz4//scaffold270_size25879//2877//4703//NITZ4_008296-RA/size25879-processed-gene-0.1-mRNA-1//1//CDS//3329545184//8586//frame0